MAKLPQYSIRFILRLLAPSRAKWPSDSALGFWCGMRKVSGERGGGAWERRIGWAKEGVLGIGYGIPLDWLGGGVRSQYWHGRRSWH